MANPQLRYKESDRRRSINNLIRMVKANTINFDQAYQRDYVAYLRRNWQRKLISSILQGEIIPMIWFRILDDLNECIDGQQRCKTFVAFEDGEFKTPTKCRAWDEVTNKYYNIGGMFWSEILLKYPNMATDWFHNREIICIECENMTDEQASEKFYKLNDLNALSNQEMRQCVQTNYCEVIRELAQDHDLFNRLIEKDKKRAEEIANELSSSIVINGDALDEDILKEANLEGSETVLALTNDDENNMMACVLAEKTGLKKRTIAIVNKTNYNLLQDSLNIDDLVDPRMTTVSRIMEHVHRGTIGTVYSLLDGEYEFIEAKILGKSELLNKKIRDANLPENIRIGAIVRKEKVIIPRSNFIFEKDDLVVFLAKREELKAVESIFSLGSI